MFSATSRFDSLPQRPPTPPRDLSNDLDQAIDFLSDSFEVERITSNPPSSSPLRTCTAAIKEQTPPSSIITSSGKRRKQVDFSGRDQFHKGLDVSALKPIDRTPRLLKSILKASQQSPPDEVLSKKSEYADGAIEHNDFSTMLNAIVRNLTSGTKDGYADAYESLVGLLKHSEQPPNALEALSELIQPLIDCIARDIQSTSITDQTLITHCIKFTSILFKIPTALRAIEDSFLDFVVDRVIAILNDPKASKVVITLHLNLIGTTRWPPHVMTTTKAERLLEAVSHVDRRVRGNGVIGQRLLLYRLLLSSAPSLMATKFSHWFEHVLHAMLSNIKDLREKAISVGSTAAMQFCNNSHTWRIVADILDRGIPLTDANRTEAPNDAKKTPAREKKYADFLGQRLDRMLWDEQQAEHVPQIWSLLLLFMKARPKPLDSWRHLKLWIQVYESFAKKIDIKVRQRCTAACNRLFYVVGSKSIVSLSMAKFLRRLVTLDIEKSRPTDEHFALIRNYALNRYCVLLYYTLRPGTSTEHLDASWQEFVHVFFQTGAAHFREDFNLQARVLVSLLGHHAPKMWNDDRVHSRDYIMLDDLPQVDARWIRQRTSTVLETIRFCFENSQWTQTVPGEITACDVWASFIRCLAQAGSHEVRASAELKSSIAHMLNFIHSMAPLGLENSPDGGSDGADRLLMISNLITTAMTQLGVVHFTEKMLSRKDQTMFEVAPTPSHRHQPQSGPKSALDCILELILDSELVVGPNETRLAIVKELVSLSIGVKLTTVSKLELLRDCCASTSKFTEDGPLAQSLWQIWARLATEVLEQSDQEQSNGQAPSQAFARVIELVDRNAHHLDIVSRHATEHLLNKLASLASKLAGPAGITLGLTLPLCAVVRKQIDGSNAQSATFLATIAVGRADHLHSSRQLKQARETIWQGTTQNKVSEHDLHDALSKMVNDSLIVVYNAFEVVATPLFSAFLGNLKNLLTKRILPTTRRCLIGYESGMSIWLQDPDRYLGRDSDKALAIYAELLQVWKAATRALAIDLPHDSERLKTLSSLIVAGLTSHRQSIVNETVRFWEETFGAQPDLQYPTCLVEPLKKMRRLGEISLPNFPEPIDDGMDIMDIEATAFLDTQDYSFLESPQKTPPRTRRDVFQNSTLRKKTPKAENSQHRSFAKQMPTTRLRHDNSQIEFTAVASSSLSRQDPGSQHLTERQEEIQQWQHQYTAALFPDLRLDAIEPSPLGPHDVSRLNVIHGLASPRSHREHIASTTPPTKEDQADTDIASSPTPAPSRRARSSSVHSHRTRSSRSRSRSRPTTEDPPSSPPKPPAYSPERTTTIGLENAMRDGQAEIESSERMEYEDSFMDDVSSSEADQQLNAQLKEEMTAQAERGSPNHGFDVPDDVSKSLVPSSDSVNIEWVDASPDLRAQASSKQSAMAADAPSEGRLKISTCKTEDTEISSDISQVADSFMVVDTPAQLAKTNMLAESSFTQSEYLIAGSDMMDSQLPQNLRSTLEDSHVSDADVSSQPESAVATITENKPTKPRGRPKKRQSQTRTTTPLMTTGHLVTETERPAKKQKRKSPDDTEMVSLSDAVVEEPMSGPQSKRLSHVAVTPNNRKRHYSLTEKDVPTASSQQAASLSTTEKVTSEADSQASTPSRRILTPKSILNRMKDIWEDMKKIAFGSQDLMQADELTKSLRREALRARERGFVQDDEEMEKAGSA